MFRAGSVAGAIIRRPMNLLSLILIFLALVVAGSISFIAWELTSERPVRKEKKEPGDGKEPEPPPGSDGSP